MKNFKKRNVAIVTGASEGMGFSIAKSLSLSGLKVLMISRSKKKLQKAVKLINLQGGDPSFLVGDVSNIKLPEKAIKKAKNLGALSVLINNTGGPKVGSILSLNEKDWSDSIENNLMSVIRFTKLAIPLMKKNKYGRIISISSSIVLEPTPDMLLSATSRAGISAFTKAIANQFAKFNITANVILPGGVITQRLKKLVIQEAKKEKKSYKSHLKSIEKSIPANRFATPDEIANLVAFLASKEAAYVNGVNLNIDGSLIKGY
jgi:3-oxoacyl-[acyl-carrier protein] reductase